MATGDIACRGNGHDYHWSWYCGDRVCDACIKHETRTRCLCGWPESVKRREPLAGAGAGEEPRFQEG